MTGKRTIRLTSHTKDSTQTPLPIIPKSQLWYQPLLAGCKSYRLSVSKHWRDSIKRKKKHGGFLDLKQVRSSNNSRENNRTWKNNRDYQTLSL